MRMVPQPQALDAVPAGARGVVDRVVRAGAARRRRQRPRIRRGRRRKVKAIGALVASGDPAALPLAAGAARRRSADRRRRPGPDRQGRHARPTRSPARRSTPAARGPRRRRRQQSAAPELGHGDRGVQARLARSRACGSRRPRNCRTAPTRTRCRRSPRRSPRKPTPKSRACSTLTQASIQLASTDRATRLAAMRALAQSDTGATKTLLLGVLEKKGGKFVEADDEVRAEAQRSLAAVEKPARHGRHRRARLQRHLARHDPAARRAGPRDHLRPDGRHQHGARRAHHDRRLRDLRRAEPVPPVRAGRVRLVSAVRDAGGVPRQRGWSAWCSSARSSAISTAGRWRRCSPRGA